MIFLVGNGTVAVPYERHEKTAQITPGGSSYFA